MASGRGVQTVGGGEYGQTAERCSDAAPMSMILSCAGACVIDVPPTEIRELGGIFIYESAMRSFTSSRLKTKSPESVSN